MLQQLFHISLASFICCCWGIPVVMTAGKDGMVAMMTGRSRLGFLAFLFLSGCITLSIVGSWFYLFLPMRFTYLLLLTLLPVLWLLLGYRRWIRPTWSGLSSKTGWWIIFPFLSILLFLLLSGLRTANRDTQIYHLQIIRWASEYRVVPGMANLYLRLGLGSNWFGLISFFNIPGLKEENFSYLNAALAAWFFCWIFSQCRYHCERFSIAPGHKILCLFYFLLVAYGLLDWELFRGAANSTNYDLIVTTCLLLVTSFILEGIIGTRPAAGFSNFLVLAVLAAIGFKFSAIFAVLLIGWHWADHRSFRSALIVTTGAVIIITPVLLRNYISTGYPLYPLSLSIGAPDWQVPRGMTDLLRNYITLSNRFYNNTFTNSIAFRTEHPAWIAGWLRTILWQHKIIVALVISSVWIFFRRQGSPVDNHRLRGFLAVLLLMVAGWFLTAPSPRFGYGILLTTAFISIGLLIGRTLTAACYPYALAALSLAIVAYIPWKMTRSGSREFSWVYPTPAPIPAVQTIAVKGIHFHLPARLYDNDNNWCYYTDLPCICGQNQYLEPRGTVLQEGFRMTPHPDSAFIKGYNY